MRFVDTNVLLYMALPGATEKRQRARALLTEADLVISAQVVQEFYYQATRPSRHGRLSHADAMKFLEPILLLPIQPITVDVFRVAVATCTRFGLSYWDAAILAAAKAAGCGIVYSEDMNHGQDYGGVRVINPFAERSPSL